jgi:uncharacterized protein (UPF0332 family)
MVDHLDSARTALGSAKILRESGDLMGAINRVYYSVFYAGRAAIAARTSVNPFEVKTHHGLWRLFDLHVVQPGHMHPDVASNFRQIEATRLAADYAEEPPIPAEVDAIIRKATEFLHACEDLIRRAVP